MKLVTNHIKSKRKISLFLKITLVEAWVVMTVVQPSPMVNSHEIESPYKQEQKSSK